jgi:hypothetical protein
MQLEPHDIGGISAVAKMESFRAEQVNTGKELGLCLSQKRMKLQIFV